MHRCVLTRLGALAFTLVELLTTIAVIGVLAGLLLPGLSHAKGKARLSVCFSNQRQHAAGFSMYVSENEDSFPSHSAWADLGGKKGQNADSGGLIEPGKRPLNAYVGNPDTFHCPSDRGDKGRSLTAGGQQTSCFDAWGNSYLVLFAFDIAGLKHVTGSSASPPDTPEFIPMRGAELAQSPASKVIQGDWIWRQSIGSVAELGWHERRNRNVILFGDGHCQLFAFPIGTPLSATPDSHAQWW